MTLGEHGASDRGRVRQICKLATRQPVLKPVILPMMENSLVAS